MFRLGDRELNLYLPQKYWEGERTKIYTGHKSYTAIHDMLLPKGWWCTMQLKISLAQFTEIYREDGLMNCTVAG